MRTMPLARHTAVFALGRVPVPVEAVEPPTDGIDGWVHAGLPTAGLSLAESTTS